MAEFSSMSSSDQNIPFAGTSTDENALGLTNPDSVLTGTNRGQQALGAPNIKTDSGNQRIVVNDNTTNRVSFGRIGTGVNDWGLKVSKPTFNVDTATTDQLIFNSSQNVFKIVQTGTYTDTATHTTSNPGAGLFGGNFFTIATIAHGLGYTPALLGFVAASGSSYLQIPYSSQNAFTASIVNWFTYSMRVDTTNVYIELSTLAYGSSSGFGGTVNFKYYLLQETAS